MKKRADALSALTSLTMAVSAGVVFNVLLFSGMSFAQTQTRATASSDIPMIFDVRKSLPMEPNEPSYHDFYINAGSEVGLKKGQYVPVQRALPIHDPVQNKQQAVLTVPVGKILVIHVERNMAVARLVTELGDDERPTLEYESIMIGDRIDMKGITSEAPKNIKKKKSAFQSPSGPTVTAMVIEAASGPDAAATGIYSAAPTSTTSSVPTSGSSAVTPATTAPVVTTPVPAPEAGKPVKTESASQPSAPPRVTQTLPAPTA